VCIELGSYGHPRRLSNVLPVVVVGGGAMTARAPSTRRAMYCTMLGTPSLSPPLTPGCEVGAGNIGEPVVFVPSGSAHS
jgi:hypothetical protein